MANRSLVDLVDTEDGEVVSLVGVSLVDPKRVFAPPLLHVQRADGHMLSISAWALAGRAPRWRFRSIEARA